MHYPNVNAHVRKKTNADVAALGLKLNKIIDLWFRGLGRLDGIERQIGNVFVTLADGTIRRSNGLFARRGGC